MSLVQNKNQIVTFPSVAQPRTHQSNTEWVVTISTHIIDKDRRRHKILVS